ncbi:M14 family zinc carboxypeptidase [Amycolatopsis alkalitolerans]|uniref:M14 family zinc carboxypeptidase n=1 Tax=Amycolatopsis alkalitolerans TaxID=2547244 RepID=UPI001357BB2F|nr:M14 family zinc carboxypeptidase [Amycolatopsis alkalitolerans]
MFAQISRLAAEVPPTADFAGVDRLYAQTGELARAHPGTAVVRRIGTSRLGEPLWCLTVQGGPEQVVVVAAVHPNEPVGGLSSVRLARVLLADAGLREELGCTWHIVPCIDPDGTRLNEPWFTGPMTLESYGRSFYRPAPDEQVEWSFPLSYQGIFFDRVLPETVALMRLIDETKPMLLCSLHNGEYGGVFYYLSRTTRALDAQLAALPVGLGLPLHTGEAEAPFIEQIAPAVFRNFTAEQELDFMLELGLDPARRTAGASSGAYAARYGTAYLATEVPYWADARADDHAPIEMSYATVLAKRGECAHGTVDRLSGILGSVRAELTVRTPFLRATEAFLPYLADAAEADLARAERPGTERPAVVAERFHSISGVQSARIRLGGMLLRALAAEIAVGHGTPAVRAGHGRLTETYAGWLAEAEMPQPIPLAKLAGVQLGAILSTAVAIRYAAR